VGIFSKIKALVNNQNSPEQSQNQINIISRRDGLSALGLPSHIAPWVLDYPKTLRCGDGTQLPIKATSTLITGLSAHSSEIITRQIVCALREGYTPVVLSSIGKNGGVYDTLRTIYPESAVHYISDSGDSGCYNPFKDISLSHLADFFYHLVTIFQQQPTNNMLVRNYINVCVKVFFVSNNAIRELITGQINHMSLLQELSSMYENNLISEQEKIQFQEIANSARDVSVMVLSVIQDYMYKMQRATASKPSIQIRPSNAPRITILSENRPQIRSPQISPVGTQGAYNSLCIAVKECLFLHIENEVPGIVSNASNAQCFQWYLSRTLQTEFDATPSLKNTRIFLIVENLSALQLRWFSWIFNLPNCVFMLNYADFYSALADAAELREQYIGRLDRIFFFSMMNEQSANWTSRFFGNHTVEKDIVTDQPARNLAEVFFKPKAIAHDREEKPWFSSYDIQHLAHSGIVYCRSDKIFKPLYCENGNLYEDKNYRGQRVNFCQFHFR
jgi:hypothetical protein